MGSRKGTGSFDPSFKGKGVADTPSPSIDQLSRGVSDMHVDPPQDDGWVEYGKKSKNKNKNNASRQLGSQQPSPKAWGRADTVQKLGLRADGGLGRGSSQTGPALSSDYRKDGGRGYAKQQSSNRNPSSKYAAAPAVIPPPLESGWQWSARASTSQHSNAAAAAQPAYNESSKADEVDDDDEESDDMDDSDDELMSDGFDSDESQKSHETRKKNRWFKDLFQCLDNLTVEQIDEPERQWHCPACKGGPGAIDWYHGLQPLIMHAKTKRSKRMKLHRELAELLEAELQMRGSSAVPAGETYGRWKGLDEEADKEIVWPPMVVIMNTRHDKDDNEKWTGMGNQDLLDYFSGYSAEKARHAYGPQGHRGMGLLIFEASAVGYVEAERLNKHFEDTGLDRIAWHRNRNRIAGGQRLLYGCIASKDDMEYFNQHSHGKKAKLKYEMRSYQEMVVKQLKQMSEDNQELELFKNKVVKEQQSNKALKESHGLLNEKLRMTVLENKEVKLRTQKLHEQYKAEMDSQEQFFNEQIQQLYDARNTKEENFEKIQQHEREKVTQPKGKVASAEEREGRNEEIARRCIQQDQEMEEFVIKRDKLMQAHEERRLELKREHEELKRKQWDEEMALEKEFDEEFNKLMEEYTPAESKQ